MLSLDELPYDILFDVFHYADYLSLMALKATCKSLYVSVDPDAMASQESKRAAYMEIEQFARYEEPCLLTCFACWQLLPKTAFGHNMARGPRGKHGAYWYSNVRGGRFCWDCGRAKKLYPEQKPLRRAGILWYLCYKCDSYMPRSLRCLDHHSGRSCLADISRVPSRLELLAGKLLEHIYSLLPYQAVLMLAQTNRELRARAPAKPEQASTLRDRMQLVRRRINHFRRIDAWGVTQQYPCYACCTIKSHHRFATDQMSRKRKWYDHRCRRCCVTMASDTEMGRTMRRDWLRRTVCDCCKKVYYEDEEC